MNRKIKSRAIFLIWIVTILIAIFFVVFKSLEDNVVYFISPTEIKSQENISFNDRIRIGGMVKKNSLTVDNKSINFIVTDFDNEIFVTYSGAIPNLFSEGKGVVVEGKLKDKNYFLADKILAKHDENYMPPEVAEALKKEKK
tara:strand:+ start:185 stop:610 length:426 start_codon:yes stop_codon:yes gene_type:complete